MSTWARLGPAVSRLSSLGSLTQLVEEFSLELKAPSHEDDLQSLLEETDDTQQAA